MVSSRIDGRLYAVVNVNAFENVEPVLLRRSPSTFDGENEQARLGRRRRNWIADVQFELVRRPGTSDYGFCGPERPPA